GRAQPVEHPQRRSERQPEGERGDAVENEHHQQIGRQAKRADEAIEETARRWRAGVAIPGAPPAGQGCIHTLSSSLRAGPGRANHEPVCWPPRGLLYYIPFTGESWAG